MSVTYEMMNLTLCLGSNFIAAMDRTIQALLSDLIAVSGNRRFVWKPASRNLANVHLEMVEMVQIKAAAILKPDGVTSKRNVRSSAASRI